MEANKVFVASMQIRARRFVYSAIVENIFITIIAVDIRLDDRGVEHAFVFRSSSIVARVVAEIISEKSGTCLGLELLPNAVPGYQKKRFSMRRALLYKHYSAHALGSLLEQYEPHSSPRSRSISGMGKPIDI